MISDPVGAVGVKLEPSEDGYDRSPTLSDAEVGALRVLGPPAPRRSWRTRSEAKSLDRLVTPLLEALATLDVGPDVGTGRRARQPDLVVLDVLRGCWRQGSAYWGWTADTWVEELGATSPRSRSLSDRRHAVIAIAYILGGFREIWRLGEVDRRKLARKILGRAAVDASTSVVDESSSHGDTDHLSPGVASIGRSQQPSSSRAARG